MSIRMKFDLLDVQEIHVTAQKSDGLHFIRNEAIKLALEEMCNITVNVIDIEEKVLSVMKININDLLKSVQTEHVKKVKKTKTK